MLRMMFLGYCEDCGQAAISFTLRDIAELFTPATEAELLHCPIAKTTKTAIQCDTVRNIGMLVHISERLQTAT